MLTTRHSLATESSCSVYKHGHDSEGGWVGVRMYVLCASLSNTHHASFEKYKYVGEGRVAHIAKIEREGEVKAHTHSYLHTSWS